VFSSSMAASPRAGHHGRARRITRETSKAVILFSGIGLASFMFSQIDPESGNAVCCPFFYVLIIAENRPEVNKAAPPDPAGIFLSISGPDYDIINRTEKRTVKDKQKKAMENDRE